MKNHITATILIALLSVSLGIGQKTNMSPEDMLKFYNPNDNIMIINQRMQDNPEDVDQLLKRARLRLYYGMDTEAAEDMELIQSLNPYALYLHGFYGTYGYLEVIERQPEEALIELSLEQRMQYYKDYLADTENRGQLTETQLLLLIRAINTIESGDLDEGSEMLNDLNERFPDLAIGVDLQSVILTEEEQYEEAIEKLSEAIALDPEYAMAWYNFGRIERLNGNYENAKTYFDEAIAIRANLSKAYFDRALVNKELENLDEAEKDYTVIIENDRLIGDEAQRNRGLARKMSGDFEGALQDLNTAISEFPDNAVLYKNRGNLYLLLGQMQDAVRDYDRAIQIDRNFLEAYYNRGLTYYILNEQEQACRDLKYASDEGMERATEKHELFCKGPVRKF